MNKLKALFRIVLAALVIASIGSPLCEAAVSGGQQTRITRSGFRIKGKQTCLYFDAQGPRPLRIGPASNAGISVFFSKMDVRAADRIFEGGKTAVREVKFRRGSDFFEVLFRWQNTSVTSSVRAGRHGSWVLSLVLTPPAAKTPSKSPPEEQKTTDFIKNRADKEPPVQVENVKTSMLFGSGISAQAKDTVANQLKPGEAPKAQEKKPAATQFVEPDQNGLALYAHANKEFDGCSGKLIFCASDVIDAYRKALTAGPGSSQAPMAIYRCGLAYYIMGKYKIAEKCFTAVTSQWPDNPVACRCWLGIGDIFMKTESYIAALESYRSGLRVATEKHDIASADYALGELYLVLGAPKQALEMLQGCLAQEPEFYIKTPRIFRRIGEAEFALGDLANGQQMLLRYVNCQESDPDQGAVLAKIAEIFLKNGQVSAAKKIYALVHKYYTNSEGDVICRIRAAELMEKVDMAHSISMYNDLRNIDLSPSLRSIVLMKLAELELKKTDLEHGLALMDQAFPIEGNGTSPSGIAPLRKRILCDLVRQLYFNRNFDKVVQLSDKYRVVFDSINSPETMEEIAESYAARKFYLKALKTYDKLLAQQHGGNLDGLLLKCAVYALRLRDYNRASRYAQAAQSGALELKKTEILGQVFYRSEQYGEAVSSFEKVLKQRNEFYITEPDSNETFGDCLYQLKKYEDAIATLKKALLRQTTTEDSRRSILVTISDCYKEQKQYGEAAEMMETAIQIAGEGKRKELLYRLSKLYLEDGHTDLAVKSLNKIVATNDSFWSAVAQQELNTIKIAAETGGKKQ